MHSGSDLMACHLGALYFMLPERSSSSTLTRWAFSLAMIKAGRPRCLQHGLASLREPTG